jgi:hypothetical protein
MRNWHSIANTGAIFHRVSSAFLGSCFIFRDVNTLLTAAHCVGDYAPQDIQLAIHVLGNRLFDVLDVQRHPSADLAVLKVQGVDERSVGWPKYLLFDDRAYGAEVEACGFPEDITIGSSAPTARVFRGHVQRFVDWKSHLGYKYLAAELSFRCPGGLSGGPLYSPRHTGRTYGLITENIRTSNLLDTIDEIQEDGKVYREHHENVIYYGMAVWLPAVETWLDSVVPPISNDELNRLAKLQQELAELDRRKPEDV